MMLNGFLNSSIYLSLCFFFPHNGDKRIVPLSK